MPISTIADYFIPVCWAILISSWVFAALRTKAVAEKQGRGIGIRALVIGAYVSVFSAGLKLAVMDWVVAPRSEATALIGMLGCGAGLIVAIWARVILAGNWSGNITLKEDHELIERGPYALVRHPIYTGFLLIFLGSAIALGRLGNFLGLLLIATAFAFKYRREEALMLKHFPDRYAPYMLRTKRLIPWIF